ncbi:MAG: hypothetical protein ACLUH5_05935 [Eubacterium sp.]
MSEEKIFSPEDKNGNDKEAEKSLLPLDDNLYTEDGIEEISSSSDDKENVEADEETSSPENDSSETYAPKELEQDEDKQIEYIESPYINRQYLRYGFDHDLDIVSVSDTFKYLQSCGFDNNYLTQARERVLESSLLEQVYDPHKENCRYCDFCGAELTGVEYEIISDGRERCNECSRTVLNSLEEFKCTFVEVRQNIENMFGIKILASIDVKTMDARKLSRKLNIKFTPSPGFDGRVLGVAINEHGIYRLYVENQSPYLNAVATIAHELTHIWQYVNWDKKAIIRKYGKKMELCIYEGMAKWVEIQYLYFINEPERAYRELCATLMRDDEYGIGLKLYLAEYDLSKGVNIDIKTPFYDVDSPLHDI